MYTLIRLQESTHPAVIKLPVLCSSPAHLGTALGAASASLVCWVWLTPSSVSCFSHPHKTKLNLLVYVLQEPCQEQREVQIFVLHCYSFHSGDK